ncbi:phenylacetic acid degradation protein PaaN [Novispirillum itersonii]|uniref:Phenylacetic acid degradation protein paaN n=1 Tax=Novispirillum itersonii TaxID=189 RepID=A0A7X0DMP1_NOVIT|nr:phenylacetic acid degradation protein PaaN [Novispirillum itersonii]MBB6211170.1 phenylacetic acid degradation protein paaN [Novispirillum itersonii]
MSRLSDLVAKHQGLLDKAIEAAAARGYWAAYPEMPSGKIYGETAKDDGEAAFKAALNQPFALDVPGASGTVGAEQSPFGFDLGITYPKADVSAVIAAAQAALPGWRKATPLERAAVCAEILERLNKKSYEIAFAVMHTTGQAFMMAFQAGGPHAQDRGLEAVVYALKAQTDVPGGEVVWDKPQGKNPPLVMKKRFHVAPRGVSVMIGCSTFPTWNGYPGLFASLATGNPVIVKPHPGAVLPLAITLKIAREVLAEAGFDPNLLILAADSADAPITKDLCQRPEVKIIDFTGSSAFGTWLEDNCRQAVVYTEKAGVNFVIIESTNDFKGMIRNMSFTLSLYTGQMCTTTQNIFIPKGGIDTEDGHKSFDEVVQALATGVDKFLSDPARAVEVLGAVQNPATAARIADAAKLGEVVLPSKTLDHPYLPGARVHTPTIIKLSKADEAAYTQECFGPVSFVIAVDDADDAIALARKTAMEHGAITAGLYSAKDDVIEKTTEACLDAQVALSVNLNGGVFVNQTAAFSDFHATGGNPSANASLADYAFVANRFRFVGVRVPA